MNERIAEFHRSEWPATSVEFLCECGQDGCEERMSMTLRGFDRLRQEEGRFGVARAHAGAGSDRVVRRSRRFLVVESIADAE